MNTIKKDLIEHLSNEGLRPQEKSAGTATVIMFKYQMLTFIICWDEDDARFLRICVPSIFSCDENNRNDVLEVLNRINYENKIVKCILADDDVWVVAEQLLDSSPVYKDIIDRTLDSLVMAVEEFFEDLRKS